MWERGSVFLFVFSSCPFQSPYSFPSEYPKNRAPLIERLILFITQLKYHLWATREALSNIRWPYVFGICANSLFCSVGLFVFLISDTIFSNTLKIQTCTRIQIKYLECWKEKQSFVVLHLYSIQFKIGSKNYKLQGNCYVGSWRLTPNYRPSLSWSSSLIY